MCIYVYVQCIHTLKVERSHTCIAFSLFVADDGILMHNVHMYM